MTSLALFFSVLLPTQTPTPAPGLQVKSVRTAVGLRILNIVPAPTGNRMVASCEDLSVRIIDSETGGTIRKLMGHPQQVYGLAWSFDGKYIASGDESARIYLWDAQSGKKLKEFRTHKRGIQALSFNRSGNLLMSTGKDDVVKMYDIKSGKEFRSIASGGLNFYGASFLPQGGFVVASLGGGVKLYGSKPLTMNFPTSQGFWDAVYNPQQNRVLGAAKDGAVVVWDAKSGQKVQLLRGHSDWVIRVTLSPNGRYAVSSSNDRTVRVWDLKALKQVALIENQSSIGSPVAISATGKYLVTANADDFLQVHALTPAQASSK